MRTLRSRFRRNTIGWRVTWRAHETWDRQVQSRIGRWHYHLIRRLQQSFGWACISGGSDCDGMRYAGVEYTWSRKQAEVARDAAYAGAEGPVGASIVRGSEGRTWEADYVPDTRDRFAERMGY